MTDEQARVVAAAKADPAYAESIRIDGLVATPEFMAEGNDDLPFSYPDVTLANPAATPRKCSHPREKRRIFEGGVACGSCGHEIDVDRINLGRRSRNRGNSIERQMAARLGLRRVGQYGGPDDLAGELFAAQVKSGLSFPERLWKWLRAVPVKAGQTALLVVTDAPGPGKRRRALVILDLEDWADLHGVADPLQLEETGQ